jgi:hypothetical protein
MTSSPFADRLVASCESPSSSAPLITVAIPHYNHRRYLEVVVDSIVQQDFDDLEIVVSDDASPDDSNSVIPDALRRSGRVFRYYAQSSNLGYDGNVRFCLRASLGRYVLLLGNDDALVAPHALRQVAQLLEGLDYPDVAFTNFEPWTSPGSIVRRSVSTRELGSGPETAARFFRSFSFLGGLIFDRAAAQLHETDRWDTSIYYQIYLACRILAAGGRVAALDTCAVRKDVHVDGEPVPSYATRLQGVPLSFASRHTGLDSVLRVAADALLPYLPDVRRSGAVRRMAAQILTVAYPFWMLEYRRAARWSYGVGVARSMWPRALLAEYRLTPADRALLWALYTAATAGGLLVPPRLFERVEGRVAHVVRGVLQDAGARG